MYKLFCIPLLVLLLSSCDTYRQRKSSAVAAFSDSLTRELKAVYEQGLFCGFSVAIVNEKGSLYQNGIGYADVEAGKPYTVATIQNIGSVSKTLVGIALLKAQELGKLQLDDSINQYLPFRVVNPYHPELPITIRHLATHTSTITDNEMYLKRNYVLKPGQDLRMVKMALDDEQVFAPSDSLISLPDYLKNVLTGKGKWYHSTDFLQRKPGEIYEYSNVATALAGYIIERATGTPFHAFTRQYILQPLQMNASGWSFGEVNVKDYSRLYYSPKTALPYYSLITYPDGNFITSAADLSGYLTELINGYGGKGKLLSAKSYREYFKAQLTAANFTERNEKNPYNDGYNVGIFMGFSVAGNIGHTGGDPGVSTMLFFNPKTKIGRLLIVNTNINDKQGGKEFFDIWDKLEKYADRLAGPVESSDKK